MYNTCRGDRVRHHLRHVCHGDTRPRRIILSRVWGLSGCMLTIHLWHHLVSCTVCVRSQQVRAPRILHHNLFRRRHIYVHQLITSRFWSMIINGESIRCSKFTKSRRHAPGWNDLLIHNGMGNGIDQPWDIPGFICIRLCLRDACPSLPKCLPRSPATAIHSMTVPGTIFLHCKQVYVRPIRVTYRGVLIGP